MSVRLGPILVVDDSEVMRTVLKDMLKRLGCPEVVVAKDVRTGMDAYQEHKPTLTLLDITMPEVPGTKLAMHILKEDPLAKVVVVTAVSRNQDLVESVISMGVYDYLRKPVKQAELEGVLDRIDSETSAETPTPDGPPQKEP